MSQMYGVDVSEWQRPGSVIFSNYEFVIVREGYGINKDKYMQQHADAILKAGKLLGFYHYAYPNYGNSGYQEAHSMVMNLRPYLGKCILALDWEGDAVSYPLSWIEEFMKTIEDETGVQPLFYTFAAEAKKEKYFPIRDKYKLWQAQWGIKTCQDLGWKETAIWQYQGDPLDLDMAFITKEQWQEIAEGGENMTKERFAQMMAEYQNDLAKKEASNYAKEAMNAMKEQGILKGDEKGNLNPQTLISRQDVAVMLHRAQQDNEGLEHEVNELKEQLEDLRGKCCRC